MRSILLAGVTATSMFLGVTASMAADPDTPVSDWNGLYAGVSLGYANVFGEINDEGSNYANNAGFQDVDSADAFTVGAQIGYNFQISDSIVLGLEVGASGVFGEDAGCGAAGCSDSNNGNPALSYDVTGLGSLNARAGFLITDDTLLYATGGLAVAEVTTNHWDSSQYDGTSRLFGGWNIGAGAEMRVTESASIRLEGRYYDFSSKNWTDAANEDFGADPQVLTISLGANFLF